MYNIQSSIEAVTRAAERLSRTCSLVGERQELEAPKDPMTAILSRSFATPLCTTASLLGLLKEIK